jgi:hypothetical protein
VSDDFNAVPRGTVLSQSVSGALHLHTHQTYGRSGDPAGARGILRELEQSNGSSSLTGPETTAGLSSSPCDFALTPVVVGSILTSVEEGQVVERGDELGYFAFGGSTIVCLFEKGAVQWDEDLLGNGRAAIETLVRMGMGIGRSKRGNGGNGNGANGANGGNGANGANGANGNGNGTGTVSIPIEGSEDGD